jgi:hypothetical protein
MSKRVAAPRFLYHAHAIGAAGTFTRQKTASSQKTTSSLQSHPTVSLPVTGGRLVSGVEKFGFEDILYYDSAETHAEGKMLEPGVFTTEVKVTVTGLNILDVLTADRIVAHLVSRHTRSDENGQPSLSTSGSLIENLRIKSDLIDVHFDVALCEEWDTFDKAHKGYHARKARVIQAKAEQKARKAVAAAGGQAMQTEEVVEEEDLLDPDADATDRPASLFRRIARIRRIPGGCTREGLGMYVPEFGMIHLGELHITPDARRLTMLRVELGCDVRGDTTCGEAGNNGSHYPPIA